MCVREGERGRKVGAVGQTKNHHSRAHPARRAHARRARASSPLNSLSLSPVHSPQHLAPQPDDHFATFHAIPAVLARPVPSLTKLLLLGRAGAAGAAALPRLGARPGGASWRFWDGKAGAAALADPAAAMAAALAITVDAYAAVRTALKGRAVLCAPPPALLAASAAAAPALADPALWEDALVADPAGEEEWLRASVPVQPPPPPPASPARGDRHSPGRGGGGGHSQVAAHPACLPPGVDLPPAAAAAIAGVLPVAALAPDQAEALAELSAVVGAAAFVAHWAGKGWGVGLQTPAVESA